MTEGYHVKEYGQPVKRYVQTMDLKDDPELIAEYKRRHSQEEAWPEIRAGIREVGILEDYMAIFQQCAEGATSDEKWQMMERMFYLYES